MRTIGLPDWSIPCPVLRTQLLEEQQSMYVHMYVAAAQTNRQTDRHMCKDLQEGGGGETGGRINNEWSNITIQWASVNFLTRKSGTIATTL